MKKIFPAIVSNTTLLWILSICSSPHVIGEAGDHRTEKTEYYQYDDEYDEDYVEEDVWFGPGFYYGIWFDNEDDYWAWRRNHRDYPSNREYYRRHYDHEGDRHQGDEQHDHGSHGGNGKK